MSKGKHTWWKGSERLSWSNDDCYAISRMLVAVIDLGRHDQQNHSWFVWCQIQQRRWISALIWSKWNQCCSSVPRGSKGSVSGRSVDKEVKLTWEWKHGIPKPFLLYGIQNVSKHRCVLVGVETMWRLKDASLTRFWPFLKNHFIKSHSSLVQIALFNEKTQIPVVLCFYYHYMLLLLLFQHTF